MSRSRDDLRRKRRRAGRQRRWESRRPAMTNCAHVSSLRDADGNVVAVAWGPSVITREQMVRDLARLAEFARQATTGASDDVVYLSREE